MNKAAILFFFYIAMHGLHADVYRYDASGRLAVSRYDNGQAFHYHYDRAGNLLEVTTDVIVPVELPGQVTRSIGNQAAIDISGGNPMGAHTYSAKGLPKGLTINPATGQIEGTVSGKPGQYTVSYWSQSGRSKSQVKEFTLIVNQFPSFFAGGFSALFIDPWSGLLSGYAEIDVAGSGLFSGHVRYRDGKRYGFKGLMEVSADGTEAFCSVVVARGKEMPLGISIKLEDDGAVDGALAEGHIPSGNVLASIRHGSFGPNNPAPWSGIYTGVFELADLAAGAPEGIGYASIEIDEGGTMSVKGKTADGTPFAGSAPSSPDARFLPYFQPYKKSSDSFFAGTLLFVMGADGYEATPGPDAAMFWQKAANPKDKAYPDGFAMLDVEPTIFPWALPDRGQSVADMIGLDPDGVFGATIQGSGIDNTGSRSASSDSPFLFGADEFSLRPAVPSQGGQTTGSNADATKETDEPSHAGNSGGKSVWWSWVPSASGTAVIQTQNSDFDTTLGVYTGSDLDSLSPVASDDDDGGNGTSLVIVSVVSGVEYHIAVDGYNGDSGQIVLTVIAPGSGGGLGPVNVYDVPAWFEMTSGNMFYSDEPTSVIVKGSVNPKTGVFSGSFTIQDEVAARRGTKIVSRKVPIEGALLQNSSDDFGAGFFLLPPLTKEETVRSGQVIISLTPPRAKYP